ncbi:TPA: hypothetical protein QDC49_000912 [Burkholderia cenocepacia]|nr:hypothetical protein [Burkholderia cenocepacia]
MTMSRTAGIFAIACDHKIGLVILGKKLICRRKSGVSDEAMAELIIVKSMIWMLTAEALDRAANDKKCSFAQ